MNFGGNTIVVTNRNLCGTDFLARIREICMGDAIAIILREKDLPEDDYARLARSVNGICGIYGKKLIAHNFPDAARNLGIKSIHLPLPVFLSATENRRLDFFDEIGTSVHSVEDAVAAEKAGASYITAGHIFDTDCKKGIPGRGLPFLRDVCAAVRIPVYAIGGIKPQNIGSVIECGAAGGCVMSLAMS